MLRIRENTMEGLEVVHLTLIDRVPAAPTFALLKGKSYIMMLQSDAGRGAFRLTTALHKEPKL
jgi:hypothetical protein